MVYVTEHKRFYARTWLGAKKLVGIQAYVYEANTVLESDPVVLGLGKGILREYSIAGWKELMGKPDLFYRPSEAHQFVAMQSL